VDAVVYYRVSNATVSVANVENAHHSTRLLAQTTLRNVLGTKNLSEILSEREVISSSMQVWQCLLLGMRDVYGTPLKNSVLQYQEMVWRCLLCVPPRAPEVEAPSAQWNFSLSLLPVLSQGRPVHSRWLTSRSGIGFHWLFNCSTWFILTHSTVAWKQFFLAVQWLGALLSSNLEESPDKSPQCMNEWNVVSNLILMHKSLFFFSVELTGVEYVVHLQYACIAAGFGLHHILNFSSGF